MVEDNEAPTGRRWLDHSDLEQWAAHRTSTHSHLSDSFWYAVAEEAIITTVIRIVYIFHSVVLFLYYYCLLEELSVFFLSNWS